MFDYEDLIEKRNGNRARHLELNEFIPKYSTHFNPKN